MGYGDVVRGTDSAAAAATPLSAGNRSSPATAKALSAGMAKAAAVTTK